MKRFRVLLGDGKYVEADVPPEHVVKAIKRSNRALKAGRGPTLNDTETIQEWLEEQDRKYGGIKSE